MSRKYDGLCCCLLTYKLPAAPADAFEDLAAADLRTPAAPTRSHIGLWPAFSLFNHSCLPNCVHYVVGSTMLVRAVRAVAAGEEVTVSYLGREVRPASPYLCTLTIIQPSCRGLYRNHHTAIMQPWPQTSLTLPLRLLLLCASLPPPWLPLRCGCPSSMLTLPPLCLPLLNAYSPSSAPAPPLCLLTLLCACPSTMLPPPPLRLRPPPPQEFSPAPVRQQLLHERYGFLCACPRCTLEARMPGASRDLLSALHADVKSRLVPALAAAATAGAESRVDQVRRELHDWSGRLYPVLMEVLAEAEERQQQQPGSSGGSSGGNGGGGEGTGLQAGAGARAGSGGEASAGGDGDGEEEDGGTSEVLQVEAAVYDLMEALYQADQVCGPVGVTNPRHQAVAGG